MTIAEFNTQLTTSLIIGTHLVFDFRKPSNSTPAGKVIITVIANKKTFETYYYVNINTKEIELQVIQSSDELFSSNTGRIAKIDDARFYKPIQEFIPYLQLEPLIHRTI